MNGPVSVLEANDNEVLPGGARNYSTCRARGTKGRPATRFSLPARGRPPLELTPRRVVLYNRQRNDAGMQFGTDCP